MLLHSDLRNLIRTIRADLTITLCAQDLYDDIIDLLELQDSNCYWMKLDMMINGESKYYVDAANLENISAIRDYDGYTIYTLLLRSPFENVSLHDSCICISMEMNTPFIWEGKQITRRYIRRIKLYYNYLDTSQCIMKCINKFEM